MDAKREVRLQKGLTLGWLGCLISTPLTGPLGLIGAATIFTGQVLRLTSKEGSWDAYCGRVIHPPESSAGEYISNPSKLSKRDKYEVDENLTEDIAKFIKKENERRNYISSLASGKEMVESYFSNLPYRDFSKIKQIEIIEKDKTFLGFPTGNKSLEVRTIK
jgi:hypothetical protein